MSARTLLHGLQIANSRFRAYLTPLTPTTIVMIVTPRPGACESLDNEAPVTRVATLPVVIVASLTVPSDCCWLSCTLVCCSCWALHAQRGRCTAPVQPPPGRNSCRSERRICSDRISRRCPSSGSSILYAPSGSSCRCSELCHVHPGSGRAGRHHASGGGSLSAGRLTLRRTRSIGELRRFGGHWRGDAGVNGKTPRGQFCCCDSFARRCHSSRAHCSCECVFESAELLTVHWSLV